MTEATSVAIPQSNVAKAGWICIAIGFVLQLVPFPLFWLYGPIFLAAFVLGIVAMSRGQTGQGIMVLIASVILPIIGFFIGMAILGSAIGPPVR